MARKHDFVYYEADATMQFINPFVDLNVENPTVAAFAGKSLKVNGIVIEDIPRQYLEYANFRGCHARTPR